MRQFKVVLSVLSLFLIIFTLSACNTVDSNEADVTDETFLTPPEQEGALTGTWTAQKDELTVNRYFYGDGKLVTIVADNEEDYTCILSTWALEEDKITLNTVEAYKYDDESGTWQKEDSTFVTTNAKKTGDDTFVSDETLPDENVVSFDFKRGLADISLPASTDLTGYINAFLEH